MITNTTPHAGRDAHLTSPPLASMILVSAPEGRAERCSWCSAPSVVKVVDRSWLDYACQAHAIEWYPTEYRILVPPTDMTKWSMAPAVIDMYTASEREHRAEAIRLLRSGNLCTLASEFRMRSEYGFSLFA